MVACARRFIVLTVAAMALALPASAPAATVVGEWSFDEGGGLVAHDISGSGLDGRLGVEAGAGGGGPPWGPRGAGPALGFRGGGPRRGAPPPGAAAAPPRPQGGGGPPGP